MGEIMTDTDTIIRTIAVLLRCPPQEPAPEPVTLCASCRFLLLPGCRGGEKRIEQRGGGWYAAVAECGGYEEDK
jgi:hypothetical protein